MLKRLSFALPCAATIAAAIPQFDAPVALGNINSIKVDEASGVTVSATNPGILWTHNDGGSDHIYAFRMDGALLADFDMGKNPTDIEDIAVGPGPAPGVSYIYIGDIGSNSAIRSTVRIYRVREPEVDLNWAAGPVETDLDGVDSVNLKYPDGEIYNSEGLMVDAASRVLYVVTKQNAVARIFKAALTDLVDGADVPLALAAELPFSDVSGASISADGSLIVLRREDMALAWVRNAGESVEAALAREGIEIPVVGTPMEPNGEAISVLPDASGYITLSEGSSQPIYFFKRTVPCAEVPAFSSLPMVRPGSVTLSLSGCSGSRVAVEASSDLSDWKLVGIVDLIDGAGALVDAPNESVKFYRLRTVP